MSDNLQDRGQQDRARINLHEKHEIQYWTEALGVTREELEQAVKQAGNSADAVRQHLRTKH
jgi:ribonuclease PH